MDDVESSTLPQLFSNPDDRFEDHLDAVGHSDGREKESSDYKTSELSSDMVDSVLDPVLDKVESQRAKSVNSSHHGDISTLNMNIEEVFCRKHTGKSTPRPALEEQT